MQINQNLICILVFFLCDLMLQVAIGELRNILNCIVLFFVPLENRATFLLSTNIPRMCVV